MRRTASDEELYDYYFSDELLNEFSNRFRMQQVIDEFVSVAKGKNAEQIEGMAKLVLDKYLQELANSLANSAKDNVDRTGELVYQVAEKTGVVFPSIPQRLIELAFMSTRAEDKLAIPVSTSRMLTLRVSTCAAFNGLKSRLGEEKVEGLPCRHGCIANSSHLFSILNIPIELKNTAKINEKGYCEFTLELQGQ